MGSVAEFLVQQFFLQSWGNVNAKMWSKSLTYAMSIAKLNGTPQEQRKLKNIYEKTTSWTEVPLPIMEDWYENARLKKTSKMKPYTYEGKDFKLHEIITALSDSFIEMNFIVTEISKRTKIELVFDLAKYGTVIQ